MNGGYGFTPIPRGGGLFSRLFGGRGLASGINWGTMLNNTQKTLNIINQAIPIAYQVKPIMNNARTMFKIIGAVKGDNNSSNITSTNNGNSNSTYSNNNNNYISNDNKPIFYL